MDYPNDFPDDLKPPVDRVIAEAEISFAGQSSGRDDQRVDECCIDFVISIFRVFAFGCCRAVSLGKWNGERARRAFDEFLRYLTQKTFYEKHSNNTSAPDGERFMQEIRKHLRDSGDWATIQTRLVRAIEDQEQKKRDEEFEIYKTNQKAQVEASPEKHKRRSSMIHSPSAAKRMEEFYSTMGPKEFAVLSGVSVKTLRKFVRTGWIRSDKFKEIAKAMEMGLEDLLKPLENQG